MNSDDFVLGKGGTPSRLPPRYSSSKYDEIRNVIARLLPVPLESQNGWAYVDVRTYDYVGKALQSHIEKHRTAIRNGTKRFHPEYRSQLATVPEDAPEGYVRVWFRVVSDGS